MCSITACHYTYKPLSKALQQKVRACGASSVYVDDAQSAGGRRLVLRQSCGLAVCPACAAYRDKKRQEAIAQSVQELVNTRPDAFFYSLTITGRLVTSQGLKRAVKARLNGLAKLLRTAFFERTSIAYVRAVEVKEIGRKHNAHIHCLLAFDVGGGAFDLSALERLCSRYFSDEGYHLKRIEPTQKYRTTAAAVVGFARYISKSAASVAKSAVSRTLPYFQHVVTALSGVRKYSAGGLLRGSLKPLKSTASDALAEGEALYKISRKSGTVIKTFFEKTKGLLGSFSRAKKQRVTQQKPDFVPQKVPIFDEKRADNRVLSVLDAFDAQTKKLQEIADEKNRYYRAKMGLS